LWKNALTNLVITATEPYQNMGNEIFTVFVFIMRLVDAKKIDERTRLKLKSIFKVFSEKVFA
jgi:hypothetical protein